jgi:hypothetical protein
MDELEEDIGVRLGRNIQDSISIKGLCFCNSQFDRTCTRILSTRPRHNCTLRIVWFEKCIIEAPCVTELLESLLENQTLHEFTFIDPQGVRSPFYSPSLIGDDEVGQTLDRIFRVNPTLKKLALASIDLRGGALLPRMFTGLRENKALKTLIFNHYPIDNEGLATFGQALENTALERSGFLLRTLTESPVFVLWKVHW